MNTPIQHKTNYKNSPLGLIPEDWEVKNLADLGQIVSGLTYSPENINDDGILVLRSSNVQDRQLKFIDNVYVKIKDEKFNPVKENDILICVRNGSKSLIGKNAIITKEVEGVAFGAFMAVFRSEFNNFLFQLFDTDYFNNEIHKNLGATINSINGSDLKLFKFPIPPPPEQTRIANCLSTWDKAIAAQGQIISQKELSKKALMQQLLSGEKRLKGFSGEWKEVMLKDVFERITTKNTEVNTNVVTISAQRGFIRQGDYFNKIVASDILDNYFLVKKGDFCYNKSYSNGYPWGATKRLTDFEKAVVTTLYICFRIINESEVSGEFFEQFFEANSLDRGLTKIAHEGGRAHGLLNVTPNDFFGLKISIPSFEEQTAIANILQCADEELQLLKKKLQQLKDQKKGLMQVLLTGKKRLDY